MSQQHGGVGVPGAAHNAAAKPYHEPAEFAAVLRHTVETLLRDAAGAHDALDGWLPAGDKKGVKLYRKKSQKLKGERCIDAMRGRGEFRVDADRLAELVVSMGDERRAIDPYFWNGTLVKQIDQHTCIMHYEIKARKCVVDIHRDMLFLQHVRELPGGGWIVASRSAGVNQEMVASPEGASRAQLFTSGWVVRPIKTKPGFCDVVYVVQADLGSLPESVLNMAARQQPLMIVRAVTYLAELSMHDAVAGGKRTVPATSKTEVSDNSDSGVEDSGDDMILEAPVMGEFNLSVHDPDELEESVVDVNDSVFFSQVMGGARSGNNNNNSPVSSSNVIRMVTPPHAAAPPHARPVAPARTPIATPTAPAESSRVADSAADASVRSRNAADGAIRISLGSGRKAGGADVSLRKSSGQSGLDDSGAAVPALPPLPGASGRSTPVLKRSAGGGDASPRNGSAVSSPAVGSKHTTPVLARSGAGGSGDVSPRGTLMSSGQFRPDAASSLRASTMDVSANCHLYGYSLGNRYEELAEYRTIIRSTIEKLLRDASGLHDEEDGWIETMEKSGVKVFRKKSQKIKGKRCIDSMRGRGTFRCNARDLRDLVIDFEDRRAIDHMFKDGTIVRQLDPFTAIVHYEIKAKKCIIDMHRDFLFLQHSRELGNGVWIVASRSAGVSQDLLPSPPGASRAELMTSGWVIRPLRDQPGMCDIVYVVQADVGALPETVLNMAAKQQPMLIARATTFLAERALTGKVSPRSEAFRESKRAQDEEYERSMIGGGFSDDELMEMGLDGGSSNPAAAAAGVRQKPLPMKPLPSPRGGEGRANVFAPRLAGIGSGGDRSPRDGSPRASPRASPRDETKPPVSPRK